MALIEQLKRHDQAPVIGLKNMAKWAILASYPRKRVSFFSLLQSR